MRYRATMLVAAALILGTAGVRGQQGVATPPPAPRIMLEDQFERPYTVAGERGDVHVLVYGDRHSADTNSVLGNRLHVHFHPTARGLSIAQGRLAPPSPLPDWPAERKVPDVRVVPVACVGSVPSVVAAIIRSQVRSRAPDLPIYLDFDNRMQQYYGLARGVSNVAVVDTRGRVRYRAGGMLTEEQTKHLIRLIESLRLEARNEPSLAPAPTVRGQK